VRRNELSPERIGSQLTKLLSKSGHFSPALDSVVNHCRTVECRNICFLYMLLYIRDGSFNMYFISHEGFYGFSVFVPSINEAMIRKIRELEVER
jgi:hypothetical protein